MSDWADNSKTSDVVVGEGVSKEKFGDPVVDNLNILFNFRAWKPIVMLNGATPLVVGDKGYVWIPEDYNGGTLEKLYLFCGNPSSSGVVEVVVKKNGVSVMTVNLTLDQAEKSSLTAAVPCVIDASKAGIAAGDEFEASVVQKGTGVTYLGVAFRFLPAA